MSKGFACHIGIVKPAPSMSFLLNSRLDTLDTLAFIQTARGTSLVARSAASRMLGYTCELEIKQYHRTLPSTRAHFNSYSLPVPLTGPLSPREIDLAREFRPLSMVF